jgi:beta-lactamase superfamily II metal-dependent hydrolase
MTKIEQADVSQIDGLLVQHFFRDHIKRDTKVSKAYVVATH